MAKSCPNCGTSNTDASKFCTSCGQNIENISKPAQQPVSHHSNSSGNACLWCNQNAGYQEEEGKLDSKWGVTAHRMKIYICRNCGYAHLFGLGRTIWDFD